MFQTSLGISYAESIIRIHEITGQRVANDKVTKQLDKLDVHYQATKIFGDICNTHLINRSPMPCTKPL
jgi:alpha-glucuronidase